MVAVVADVVDQVAVPVEDQHVLVEAAGGEAVDRREVADGFSREGRNRHQWESEDEERDEDKGTSRLGPALTLAKEPQPAVEEIAGATAARHQAAVGNWDPIAESITKNDSGYVGKHVKTEIIVE
jgi:hypothetical protein